VSQVFSQFARTEVGVAAFVTSGTIIAGLIENRVGRKENKQDIAFPAE
jgi:hypothetical protein